MVILYVTTETLQMTNVSIIINQSFNTFKKNVIWIKYSMLIQKSNYIFHQVNPTHNIDKKVIEQ
jgi:hypothetical protein